MGTSGSPRKLTLDGVTFGVAGDADITINLSKYTTEGIASSGAPMYKKTKRVPTIDTIAVLADSQEQQVLRELAERITTFPMSLTLADNSVYRNTGQINFENVTTADNRATIQLIPENDWTLAASAT